MAKVYDRVEWSFLEAIMLKLGFSQGWVSLMIGCVHSVTYSVLLNDEPVGPILPTRGLC